MDTEKVLVTGASGFIGLHLVVKLLDQGCQVRGTIRSLKKEPRLREVLARHTSAGDRLELVEADLTRDDGWEAAVSGCEKVFHVASPFRLVEEKDAQSVIVPAVEGTRRVLQAAEAGGARRVVLTSSTVAITSGNELKGKLYTEEDWSDLSAADPYGRSKTLAERSAWEFVRALPPERKFELAVINPSLVMGPAMDESSDATSFVMVKEILARRYPGNVRLHLGVVDVRDVADAHIAAMETPEAAGERFICQAGELWMQEIAKIIDKHFASRGYPVRTNQLPDFALRLVGLYDANARSVVNMLGKRSDADTSKIRRVLGWNPRPMEETVVDTVESLIALKMV